MIGKGAWWLAGFLLALAAWGAPSALAEEARSAVPAEGTKGTVFSLASARMDKRWTKAGFDGLPEGAYQPNACESSLAAGLRSAGYAESRVEITDPVRSKARELRTVFRRYDDMSSIPNDFAVRIGAVVDPAAKAVVACGVSVSAERKSAAEPLFQACARANCKAIAMADRRRIATASGARCLSHADRTAGGEEAQRLVCAEMGTQLGGKIGSR